MKEQSFAFGDEGGLVGTICLPSIEQASRAHIGLVLFNAGVVHRIGPHRLNVRLARRLAARGIPSIRFDLTGQGDSARSLVTRSFEEQAVEDLRAAMGLLCSVAKVPQFALFGFCSGGVNSYAAAKVDERVAGLMMFDTYIYPTFWSIANRYVVKIRSRGLVTSTTGWFGRRLRWLTDSLPAIFRPSAAPAALSQAALFVTPAKAEFAKTLTTLDKRGVKIGMVYSRGFEQYNYRNQFADAFRRFGINAFVKSEFMSDMDHTATLMAQQEVFMQVIERWSVEVNDAKRDIKN